MYLLVCILYLVSYYKPSRLCASNPFLTFLVQKPKFEDFNFLIYLRINSESNLNICIL